MPQSTIQKQPSNVLFKTLADMAQGAKNKANMVNAPVVGGLGDFLLNDTPEFLNEIAYNGLGALGKGGSLQTFTPDIRLLDLAGLLPVGAVAGKGAKAYGKLAGKELARQVETGSGLVGKSVIDPRMNIVKNPETQQRAIDYYGLTNRPTETGYILDEGQRLDFTGRRDVPSDYKKLNNQFVSTSGQDYLKNERSTDHRDVFNVLPQSNYGWDALADFIDQTGAVRYLQDVGVSMVDTNKPSKKQIETIVNDFRRTGEPLTIDIDSKTTGSSLYSQDFNNPTVQNVQKWIDEVYGGLLK